MVRSESTPTLHPRWIIIIRGRLIIKQIIIIIGQIITKNKFDNMSRIMATVSGLQSWIQTRCCFE